MIVTPAALLFVWIAGAVLRLFFQVAEYIQFMHVIERCPDYLKHDMEAVIARINRECGKERKFKVLFVPGIWTPAIFGLVHPKILMPGTDYTEREIYYIVKHEMLHYYEHDVLIKVLCEVLCIVFWWNPLVFLLRKSVARALERKVDCLLTAEFSEEEKISYMECIVKSMKAGSQEKKGLILTFATQKEKAVKRRFHCIWENNRQEKWQMGSSRLGGRIMRKTITLKTLLRAPVKTTLTFLLIAAASFALFSRVTDYAVTTRETKNAMSFYNAYARLNNDVQNLVMSTAYVESPDMSDGKSYDFVYEMEDKPWLTKEELEEFLSLPGAEPSIMYTTAGRVEDYKRIMESNNYGGYVLFEGTYGGYEEDESVIENHVRLKFDDVKVIAQEEGPEVGTSFTTESSPLGDMYYSKSSYTRAFYDSLEIGTRCLMLAENSGQTTNGSSGIKFYPCYTGEGTLRVIDGLPDNYLETEDFALQKSWVDAINHNLYTYDIMYTADMRALGLGLRSPAQGRPLTEEDTDACVVSESLLEEHGLSIGDRISVQLGEQLCHDGYTKALKEIEVWNSILDPEKIPEFTEPVELTIVGAYASEDQYSSHNDIYVPASLLPVEVPEDYVPSPYELSVFVENARDIKKFHKAVEQFAEKTDLNLTYDDGGWLDVEESFQMGAFTSLLTTVLYVLGAALALFLAVYLYIGRNKRSYAIMRTLGVPGKEAGNSVVLPLVAVSALAMPIGGIAGLYYAQRTAEKALLSVADNAPAGYVPDANLPIGVAILCLFLELLFVSLLTVFFLRNMKNIPPLELLQEGVVQANRNVKAEPLEEISPVLAGIDMAKLSAAREWIPTGNYGPVRHVAAYIRRHMRRSTGKTAVSLILAVVLAAGIGTLTLAKSAYQDAYYTLGVKGSATQFTFTSALELSKSSLVKDFYCYETFGARVQGLEVPMTITSDLVRNIGKDCTVDYAEGYDSSSFEGTAQVCLVGEELAKELGVSPGDEIGILSDLLYSILAKDEDGDAVSEGYKPYKVIGVAAFADANLNKGIYAGIKSDLYRLFSMEFTVAHCEFTLTDNDRVDELDALLTELRDSDYTYALNASYHLDSGGLAEIVRIRGLLESLFPIAVAAAVLIGVFGAFLVILQSAQEAAFLRILGVTKKRARCMLVFEQVVLCIAGIVLVVGGIALSRPGLFVGSVQTLAPCFGLYFLGCVCGATVAAVQVTRGRLLELLQVKE